MIGYEISWQKVWSLNVRVTLFFITSWAASLASKLGRWARLLAMPWRIKRLPSVNNYLHRAITRVKIDLLRHDYYCWSWTLTEFCGRDRVSFDASSKASLHCRAVGGKLKHPRRYELPDLKCIAFMYHDYDYLWPHIRSRYVIWDKHIRVGSAVFCSI